MQDGDRPEDRTGEHSDKPFPFPIKGRRSDRPKVATALIYDAEEKGAVPRVVATGKGLLADRIIEVAQASDIPVYQDPQLAWTLAGLGLGREIPPELYQVVAQVIAWVYYLENAGKPPTAGGGETGSGGTT